uniref:Uncharacterized protein n=1 Tax=Anguilla anguilla TaxID=7936 RepID=A0A0E9XJ85_ANGAN
MLRSVLETKTFNMSLNRQLMGFPSAGSSNMPLLQKQFTLVSTDCV